ncbi:MAG: glycosyltransferase family 2 protein [Planctomycetes bacterium]|nr:glycosyltransferase family 2 protein [Planctomycetota bacterium]
MADESIRISVVIPAYNERLRIKDSLKRIVSYFEQNRIRYEIIVVDDGSTDGTARIVEAMARRVEVIRLVKGSTNRGKGHAVRRGMMTAHGDYILMTDADLSTPIEEIEKLLSPIDTGGYDIAIGSRALPQSDVRVRQSMLRERLGKFFNVLVRVLAVRGFRDTQCGFKCFTARAARAIFTRQTIGGFCFDVEVLTIARALGLSIREVPVAWVNSPESRVHIIREPIRMFVDLLRIALRKFADA